MPDPINEKPFNAIAFTLAGGAVQQYESASSAVLFFAEGPGIGPGAISIQLDEFPAFRISVGFFLRVKRFDKIRIINNIGTPLSGVFWVSTYPDFLSFVYNMGI